MAIIISAEIQTHLVSSLVDFLELLQQSSVNYTDVRTVPFQNRDKFTNRTK